MLGHQHSHLLRLDRLKDVRYICRDILTPGPIILLRRALKTFLPDEAKVRPESAGNRFLLGNQHAFFRTPLSQPQLCSDGTDVKFLPGPDNIWKYRLWAGGSVTSNSYIPPVVSSQLLGILSETVSDVRVVEKGGEPNKVFVTIERKVAALFREGKGQLKQLGRFLKGVDNKDTEKSPFLVETENICFLREPPPSLQDSRKIRPPADPTMVFKTTPTQSLLFQFSALTYNAHSIHLDRDFARRVYGAKDLVVHGPLTQVLMCEFLNRYLCESYQKGSQWPFLKSINYTNLQPLYVDEPLTLCCKPASESGQGLKEGVQRWQVWIQTGTGDDVSCAVKATIAVEWYDCNDDVKTSTKKLAPFQKTTSH